MYINVIAPRKHYSCAVVYYSFKSTGKQSKAKLKKITTVILGLLESGVVNPQVLLEVSRGPTASNNPVQLSDFLPRKQ